ncbi:membrane magnesium transporter 1-like [Pollicipes pollicipes]|uniref:membrane magnesium transporter 1-like n=1 Tax=Pollicipes pollicipes TaxID=41117 RepID=UPI0018849DE1|nr:membrane magnesium transporter 1-like [Pollicipes pollicipes]
MVSLFYKIMFACGILSLLHTAYSATQHRSYLRLTEQEFTALPADIIVQGVLSLILSMYAILFIAGDFREIRANVDLQEKTWDTVGHRPSFMVFSHRGRCLSAHYPAVVDD